MIRLDLRSLLDAFDLVRDAVAAVTSTRRPRRSDYTLAR